MNINFKISDFNISGEPIPADVANKILEWHILPGQETRNDIELKMWPSLKSSYRSPKWEEAHNRSGNSQHTYKGKGATDWTCYKFATNKDIFLAGLIKNTTYTRFAIYRSFIHCDYKRTGSGKRQIFKSTSSSRWTLTKEF